MNYAFVTLLSSADYLNAVIALKRSLVRVQSKYPLVVMITASISTDFTIIHSLQKENIIIEIIPDLSYVESLQEKWKKHSVLNTASKIYVFNLKHYDKLVYIDADSFFVRNADELFNYPDGAILMNEVYGSGGISGLFVFIPQMHTEYNYLKVLIENIECFDGSLFDHLWFHAKTNKDYQLPVYLYCFAAGENSTIPEETKIIHLGHQRKWWWTELERKSSGEVWNYYRSLLK